MSKNISWRYTFREFLYPKHLVNVNKSIALLFRCSISLTRNSLPLQVLFDFWGPCLNLALLVELEVKDLTLGAGKPQVRRACFRNLRRAEVWCPINTCLRCIVTVELGAYRSFQSHASCGRKGLRYLLCQKRNCGEAIGSALGGIRLGAQYRSVGRKHLKMMAFNLKWLSDLEINQPWIK